MLRVRLFQAFPWDPAALPRVDTDFRRTFHDLLVWEPEGQITGFQADAAAGKEG